MDFDEEEGQAEQANQQAAPVDESGDVQMSAADMSTDPADESTVPVRVNNGRRQPPQAAESSRADSVAPGTPVPQAPPAQAPKRRMVISHDKYVELQSMVMLHLNEHETKTGRGLDREELIDWYLEQKEDEMQDIDQLDYEKELITKLLRKLVKVRELVF